MKNKIMLVVELLLIICIVIVAFMIYKSNMPYNEIIVDYAYSPTDYENVPHIFVAKINKIERTDYRDSTPYTIYNITVKANIKGNLDTSKNIEFSQMGGIAKNRLSYLFPTNSNFLVTGNYYLIFAFDSGTNEMPEASSASAMINLGILNDNDISNIQKIFSATSNEELEKIENEINNSNLDKVIEYKKREL